MKGRAQAGYEKLLGVAQGEELSSHAQDCRVQGTSRPPHNFNLATPRSKAMCSPGRPFLVDYRFFGPDVTASFKKSGTAPLSCQDRKEFCLSQNKLRPYRHGRLVFSEVHDGEAIPELILDGR